MALYQYVYDRIYLIGQLTICTRGFLDINQSVAEDRQIPLLGREGLNVLRQEQWIFPTIQFTCHARVTGWRFIGVKGTNFTTSCSVQFTTWRQDASSSTNTYRQVSTTEGNVHSYYHLESSSIHLQAD